jgi:peptidoglycan-associated lipoprotein
MNKAAASILATMICAIFAGCSSTPIAPPAAPTPLIAPAAPPAPMASGTVRPVAPSSAVPAYLDPSNPISTQRSVYFDYDDFSIKPEYRALVERHAKYLVSMPRLVIRVEGNTDERGSAEYNLALGQKRAEAVNKALEIYGVKETELEAVSFGAERPVAPGHDEAAWAQNRRVDLSYPKQ